MTTTASPGLTCPSWCTTSAEDHYFDPVNGATVHYAPQFGLIQISQGAVGSEPTESVNASTGDTLSGLDAADLRELARDCLDAAAWLDRLTHPDAEPDTEPLVHFWLCTAEGRPFLSRILCDAAAQRESDGSRMTSGWDGVTCPRCVAAGPETADAIKALPDVALVALGAWPVPTQGEGTVQA